MKINFVLSDTTKSATTETLKKVLQKSEEDFFTNNIVIVPETKSIIIEKELLALSKSGVLLNVFVYSFVRLLDRIGDVPYDKILSKQALILLLKKIILENYDKLTCYKKTAKTVGFAEKMYENIAQFKSCNISADDLRQLSDKSNKGLQEKLNDIILLYEEYENKLKGKYLDECDKLSLISSYSKENDFLKTCNVYIVGFDNITIQMQSVLKGLAVNSKEITFSAVYINEKKRNKHICTNELYKKFRHIADELKYPYEPEYISSRKRGDFKVIQDNLFYPTEKKYKTNGLVEVFKAKTDKIELDFVANTILTEIEKGRRFKDFGLYVCGLSEKEELIRECFNKYKIPYFINSSNEIDKHFFVKFLINIFELSLTNLQSDKVLSFVSNPIFDAQCYDLFENYVYETGSSYGDFLENISDNFLQNYFEKYKFLSNSEDENYDKNCILSSKNTEKCANLSKKAENNDKNANNTKNNTEEKIKINSYRNIKIDELKQTLLKLQNFYREFNEKVIMAKTTSDFISIINFAISYFDCENKLNEISKFQKENGLIIESEITSVILQKVKNYNNQILNFLGDESVTLKEFLMIYTSGFASIKLNISPVSIDCVIVQDNTDGFYDIAQMFIVGAVDGAFPGKIQDCGVIVDSELNTINSVMENKFIEPTINEINKREKFRIYETLLEPKEKLYISYSEKLSSGKVNMPSEVITNLFDLFKKENIEKTSYNRLNFVNFDILESKFAKKVCDYNHDNLETSLSELSELKNLLGDKISENLGSYIENQIVNADSNYCFSISGLSDLYFYNNTTSISQIETYFDCPYKFFYKYAIKLRENKIAEIRALDLGTIIHRVAELFVKNLSDYKDLAEQKFKTKVYALLDYAISENHFNQNKNLGLIKIVKEECVRLCKSLMREQSESNFKFNDAEYEFENEKAVKLNSTLNPNLTISGKVDRIDKFNDYIRIIDYKTGKISKDLKSIYYGTKIQLAVYLEAMQKISNTNVAGILYFPIHSEFSKNEDETSKMYRMDGFLLSDVDVLKNMDIKISEENKVSDLVNFKVKFDKKTGIMSLNEKCTTYSSVEFDAIKNYVNKLCSLAVDEILGGYIEPSPIADENSLKSCANCPIYGFCGLEKSKFSSGRRQTSKITISSFYEENKVENNDKEDDDNE